MERDLMDAYDVETARLEAIADRLESQEALEALIEASQS